MNILENINLIKKKVTEISDDAYKSGFLTKDEHENLILELKKEKVRIGVIGQIKYGKSTLLNALIFDKPVLPAATTPMTASLTYITYGKGDVEVEFYSNEDWKDIKKTAQEKGEDYEVRAAKELVEKAKAIKEEINTYLGKKKIIKFSDLSEYVGEGGRFVPITKAILIKYPHERLKEAEFVDTPGFNDPVASREKRAQEFLSESDVVLVLLYAGRPFDKTDRELLFDRIVKVGTGKVIIIINKVDIVMEEQGGAEKAREYIEEQFRRNINEIENKHPIVASIFKGARIINMSSLWALLGKMNERDILDDEDLKYHYENSKNNFPGLLKTHEDFLKHSGLKELEEEIENILRKEKYEILVKKPITFILGKYKQSYNKIRQEAYGLEIEEKSLNRKLEDIKEEIKGFEKLEEEMKEYIENEGINFLAQIKKNRNEVKNEIRHKIQQVSKDLSTKIPEKGWLEIHSTYSKKVSLIVSSSLRDLKKECEKLLEGEEGFKYRCSRVVKNFIDEIDTMLTEKAGRYLDYTIDQFMEFKKLYLKTLDEKTEISIRTQVKIKTSGWWFFRTSTAKPEAVKQAHDHLDDKISPQIKDSVDKLYQSFEDIYSTIKEKFELEVIIPLKNSLERAERNYSDKEHRLKEIKSEKDEKDKKSKELDKKIKNLEKEMESLLSGK